MKKQTFSKTALSLAIAFSVGGLATEVMAQEIQDRDQESAITKTSVITERTTIVNGSLVEVGTPQNSANLKGFAKDLPLIAVLKQITPNEWIVKKAKGRNLDLQKTVSWSGGKTWVETLRDIAMSNRIEVVVHWDRKEVILAQLETKAPVAVISKSEVTKVSTTKTIPATTSAPSIGVFELSSDVVAEGHSGQTEVVTKKVEVKPVVVKVETKKVETVKVEAPKPVVVVVPVAPVAPVIPVVVSKSWNFEGKDNLKEVVESWGKKAGYKVVYTAENYPIDKEDPRVIMGEFDGENGPIKQLSLDYGPQSRAKKPLSFIFFQNRTLVVEDLRYEQSGYPQYIQK